MIITRLITCFALLLCVSSAPHSPLPNLTNGKNCSCLLGQLLLVLSDLVKNQQSPCNQDQLKPAEADPDSSIISTPIVGSPEGDGNSKDPNSHGLGAQGLYLSTTSEPTTTNSNDDCSTTTNSNDDCSTTTNPNDDCSTTTNSNDDCSTTTSENENCTTTTDHLSLYPDSTSTGNPFEGITLSTTSSSNSQDSATTENSIAQTNPTTLNPNAETATTSSNNQDVPNFAIADLDGATETSASAANQDDGTNGKNPDNDQTTIKPNDVEFANNHNHDPKKCSCGNIDGQFYVPLLRFEGKPDKEAFKFYLDCLFNRKS